MSDYSPSLKEFVALSKKGNLVPVYQEVLADLETPVSVYLKLGQGAYSYLLESVEGGEKTARFSFVGAEPSLIFKSQGKTITIQKSGKKPEVFETPKDPLYELEVLMKKYRSVDSSYLAPFTGGAVGYLGYDTVRFIENIPDKNASPVDMPESLFIFTDTLIIFDYALKKMKVVANVFIPDYSSPEEAHEDAIKKIQKLVNKIKQPLKLLPTGLADKKFELKTTPSFTKKEYEKAVLKAKEYIKKGDIFQVVLSQSFSTPIQTSAFQIYRALRTVNPSPYMFYLNCKDFELVGSSPEVHVRSEKGVAALRPIAGTRRRGSTPEEDLKLEKDLLADSKERAEHLMLVDLGRNDLGRVCDFGSVRVSEFMVVERYSHVMHIVSHVEGELAKKKNVFDLMRATFPAGTISGAPKVRAMEIIDELENERRNFYSGVVGYFSYSGNLDSCIAIRTLLVQKGIAYARAGAGIVTDSVPNAEYQETLNKARALIRAIELAHTLGDF